MKHFFFKFIRKISFPQEVTLNIASSGTFNFKILIKKVLIKKIKHYITYNTMDYEQEDISECLANLFLDKLQFVINSFYRL